MSETGIEQQLRKMRQDWDARARENARHYVQTAKADWNDETFFESGEQTVKEEILTDMVNICQGKPPSEMRVLEIGCGAGRVTRALAKLFGEVHAVDVSGEMVKLATRAVREYRPRPPFLRWFSSRPDPDHRAFVYRNNGKDLRVVPELPFDFAFSSIVFQHIPSREIIENYVREVHRLLRPGALFKFQVQGSGEVETKADDTWIGVSYSEAEAAEMASRCGFELRFCYGAGEQYFWLWFFKR